MSRQFRSDDTSPWSYKFGSGSDGAYTPSTSTDSPIDSACTGTASTNTLTATNASFASGKLILIHQTQGTGAGNWELNSIQSYTAGTITTGSPLENTYSTGAQVLVLNQYSSVTIGGGVTLSAKAWNGTTGGILGWICNGTTSGSGTIQLSGKGFRGATSGIYNNWNNCGEGTGGGSTNGLSGAANGNGGGGGKDSVGEEAGGGGGGGNASSGGNGTTLSAPGGTGGNAVGTAGLTGLHLGGGGGAGGSQNKESGWVIGGNGGNGGAILIAISKTFSFNGTISNGGGSGTSGIKQGSPPNEKSSGGGGGGAGGSILFKCQSFNSIGTITAVGASGGGGSDPGGNGSNGRIHLDYLLAPSGSTTPTLDSRFDGTFADTGGAFLFNMI